MNGLWRDTLAEMVSRKMFVLFIIVTIVLFMGVWGTWEIRHDMPGQMGDQGLGEGTVNVVTSMVVEALSKVMSVFVFLAVLATVGLIPRSLERGRAEFLLSKPLSRSQIYTGKLVSIWLVYGLMMTACGVSVYLVAVIAHGGFNPAMAYLFLMALLQFAVWLSIIGLASVWLGSASWAMIIVFSLWVAQNLLSYHDQLKTFFTNQVIVYTVETLYYLVPKTGQMSDLAVNLAAGRPVESWLPLWSSLVIAGVLYYCAVWTFNKRDY